MACEINASPSNGLVQSADGSGIIKLKSNGVTTNALAWVNFNGTGTVAIRSSYNVSSITDNGTGNYTVNFATALSDADYAVSVGSAPTTNGRIVFACVGPYATSGGSFTQSVSNVNVIGIGSGSSGALADLVNISVTIHGN
jgi:hypothetical protein